MKVFVIGKHASGKHEVLELCSELGIRAGHEFSNIPEVHPNLYIDPHYEKYGSDDINHIFDQGSYVVLGGVEENNITDSYMYQRGISFYTYDNSDVMVLNPAQLETLNRGMIKDHILFVWLDNTRNNRIHRHVQEHRTYSFTEIEHIESRYDKEFVKHIYNFPNSSVIYFTDEVPERVASIITAIVKHPELEEMFVENFN